MYPVLANLTTIIAGQRSAKGGGEGFLASKATWDWGYRLHPVTGEPNKWHNGIDLPAPRGTEILAPLAGTVIKVREDDVSGRYLKISHKDPRYPKISETAYAHLDDWGPGIKEGLTVVEGQVIGYVGTTGRSTGNHLHYIIRESPSKKVDGILRRDVDPLIYIEKKTLAVGGSILGGLLLAAGLAWWMSKHGGFGSERNDRLHL